MPKSPENRYSLDQAQEEAEKLQEKIKSGETKSYDEAERLLDEKQPKNAESLEGEPKPFFFIYRENDLFDKYIPVGADLLKEKGRQVRIQSFPAGTPEKEIEDWCIEHKSELQSFGVYTDNTTRDVSSSQLNIEGSLDGVIREAMSKSIAGVSDVKSSAFEKSRSALEAYKYAPKEISETDFENEKQKYLSALGEMYKKILTCIPEEQRQKMEVVILKGIYKGNVELASIIAHEPYGSRENPEQLIKDVDDFADQMKDWFGDSGISNVAIFSTGAEIPAETIKKLTAGEAYIIFDRHTPTPNMSMRMTPEGVEKTMVFWGQNAMYADLIKEQVALETPIETFFGDAQEKMGIKFTINPKYEEWLVANRLSEKISSTRREIEKKEISVAKKIEGTKWWLMDKKENIENCKLNMEHPKAQLKELENELRLASSEEEKKKINNWIKGQVEQIAELQEEIDSIEKEISKWE